MSQIQNLQNVRITHLVLDGYAEKIKVLYGILGFQRK